MLKTAKGRLILAIVSVLVLAAISVGIICGVSASKRSAHQQVSTAPKKVPISFLVFVDLSQSLNYYTPGGVTGIRKDYFSLSKYLMKQQITDQDITHVTVREFCNHDIAVFDNDFTLWERLSPKLKREFAKPTFTPKQDKGTFYEKLFPVIADYCLQHPNERVSVLLLTDGHPDDQGREHDFPNIQKAAKAFQTTRPSNFYGMVVGCANPDIKMMWREHLETAFQSVQNVIVVNNQDCKGHIARFTQNF